MNQTALPGAALQLVRFTCGWLALLWGTNQHVCRAAPIRIAWEPHHERASLFRPRYSPSLDAEFTRYMPPSLPDSLLTATLVRHNCVVFAADVDRLCAAANSSARHATRLEALPAHVWKLLAAAVGGLDAHCRMDAVDEDPC
ncbi:uncharacterized protein [Miscanthus floridulus]|uniref:uncharacterized protein n=1 Tax=Miscanthus floridulus TaxID=154761 RepID=UPI003459BBBA